MPISGSAAAAQDVGSRQSIEDAWWTGPLFAASPEPMARGHWLVEPYIYDSIESARYDRDRGRTSVPREDDYGSLTYIFYGLTDKVTVGLLPLVSFKDPSGVRSSSNIAVGDLALQAAVSLADFGDAGWLPAISLVGSETLPTGRYERLHTRTSDGMGAGSYTTTISVFSQYYFWMPNGRLLRTRLDVSHSWSKDAHITGSSVYDTPEGFRGRAKRGASDIFDLSFEYSITREWVAAIDLLRETGHGTLVIGRYPEPDGTGRAGFRTESGPYHSAALVPAVEYCWSADAGVIVGAKFSVGGSNTTAALIPIVGINLSF